MTKTPSLLALLAVPLLLAACAAPTQTESTAESQPSALSPSDGPKELNGFLNSTVAKLTDARSTCYDKKLNYEFQEQNGSIAMRVYDPCHWCWVNGSQQLCPDLQTWTDLGTATRSTPSAVTVTSRNEIRVFYRGPNFHLWMIDGLPGSGHAWDLGGALLGSAPSAIATDDRRIDVFYRDNGSRLKMSHWDGGPWWSGVYDLGTTLTSAPAAVMAETGLVYLFYRNAGTSDLTEMWRDKRSSHSDSRPELDWSAPADLGGVPLASSVLPYAYNAGSPGADTFIAYYCGPNNHVWTSHRYYSDMWWSAPEEGQGACP